MAAKGPHNPIHGGTPAIYLSKKNPIHVAKEVLVLFMVLFV
jgi:hypothetical protein